MWNIANLLQSPLLKENRSTFDKDISKKRAVCFWFTYVYFHVFSFWKKVFNYQLLVITTGGRVLSLVPPRVGLWVCQSREMVQFTSSKDEWFHDGHSIAPLYLEVERLTLSNSEAIVPHRIIWSGYTGRWWVGCYIWYSEEGTGRVRSAPWPVLVAVSNATAQPSTASVPITVLLYNGPLLCGFNVPIKG